MDGVDAPSLTSRGRREDKADSARTVRRSKKMNANVFVNACIFNAMNML
jgi:hypothetical protein